MKLLIAFVGVVVLMAGGPLPAASAAPSDDPVLFDVTNTELVTSNLARSMADGSGFRRVTRPNRTYHGYGLSPDKRLIAIWSGPGLAIDIATPTGAERRQIFSTGQWGSSPVWSPDSSKLLMTADRGSGREFLVVPIDGADPVRLGAAVDVPALDVVPFAWSPDGSTGVFRGVRYDDEGVEHPAYFRVRRSGEGLSELVGWTAYAARPGGSTGVAVVTTDAGADIVEVGPRLGVKRTLLPVRAAPRTPEVAWSADGRRVAVLHGGEGHQRISVLDGRGRSRSRIIPRQPVGPAAFVGNLAVSSGGSVLSWSYANFIGSPFTRAEGLFFHDLARRRTCRKASPDHQMPWATVTYAPDDRYAVIDDAGVRGLVPLRRPRRLVRAGWSPAGTSESNIEFRERTRATVDTKPCRAS